MVNSAGTLGPTNNPINGFAASDFEKVCRVNLLVDFDSFCQLLHSHDQKRTVSGSDSNG